MPSPPTIQVDPISLSESRTLPGLFRCRVQRSPAQVAYRQFEPAASRWVDVTWGQAGVLVARWRRALSRQGLNPGDRVAVQLRNSVEWGCFAQAALAQGLVVVPLYTNDNPENVAYVVGDAGARLLLVGDLTQWEALSPHQGLFPALEDVVCVGPAPRQTTHQPRVHDLSRWLPESAEPLEDPPIDPHGLALLVYTSGTTGRPKGVMLSHQNILWNAQAMFQAVQILPEDLFLSFLPLSHIFELTVGYCLPMLAGSGIAYARSVQQLVEDLGAVRPTVLISVPRIYERAYARIQERLAQRGRLARLLFEQAVAIGWRRFEAAQGRGRPVTARERLLWALLKPLVADKVLARLGGRLRLAVSGAAPLQPHIARCFLALGLTLLEGYGLTEAAPTVCGNTLENNLPGSVGPPLPGVEVRVTPAGQLLVRSPGVMLGYWNRPEATRRAVDGDGWLHTGDLAELRDGRVFIRGRIDDVIVMSTGEKLPAADLEAAIVGDPLFDQALVLGEGKPFLVALLVLNPAAWSALTRDLGLDPQNPASLSSHAALEAARGRVAQVLRAFPVYARVPAVHLALDPWTIENRLLTPTLKPRRKEIALRFEDAVRALYVGHALPDRPEAAPQTKEVP
ncbi:MAG TPA: AMP-dependent synthetase/ligase [Desulfobacterales bacterium]|nr:AMP-dependent synthetase/ligase [Desulfobacterales bacterium]